MPLGFDVTAGVASGGDTTVVAAQFNGIGPVRLHIKNTGSVALTGCKVQIGAVLAHVYDFDTATFATLAAGAMTSLRMPGPIDAIKVLAAVAADAAATTLRAWLADSQSVQG